MVAREPARVIAASHVGEIEVIVAVVDQDRVKCGRVQVLRLARFVGQLDVELLALGSLKHRLGFGLDGLRFGLVGLDKACLYLQRPLIALLGVDNHHLTGRGGALKAILILDIYCFSFNSCNATSAHIVQKSHIVSYLHIFFLVNLSVSGRSCYVAAPAAAPQATLRAKLRLNERRAKNFLLLDKMLTLGHQRASSHGSRLIAFFRT